MGWFDDGSHQADAYNQVTNTEVGSDNQASWTHELIAGAASYEAAKAYENHVAKNGPPPTHQKAKELLAGFAGAFVDREVETRGLDFVDREKAKHQAKQHAEQALANNNEYGWN